MHSTALLYKKACKNTSVGFFSVLASRINANQRKVKLSNDEFTA